MMGEHEPVNGEQVTTEHAAPGDENTMELIARIRALAAHDPAVRQVVTDVLAELDRVTGGAFRDGHREDGTLAGPGLPGPMAPTSPS
ncbi:hypothetical protein [Micromonospora sp. NPDC049679]|uniref:hypothetical protein n=1 Tax=Micromonospora sp. NPDC049679 TaxID=3155920 RepID=UPI0033C1D83B